MIIPILIITGLYVILIAFFIYGFDKIKSFETYHEQYTIRFSIIIPFRNEALNLPQLLDSITELSYFKNQYEIIFVNDDSSDNSVEIIQRHLSKTEISYAIINNQRKTNSPKKDAINIAIQKAQFEWILTTDADCVLPKNWLKQFGEFIHINNSKMVIGPVMYKSDNFSFLEHFQILDILSLQGATVGGFGIQKPFLCNGANLAYEKKTFIELNGFEGNTDIASGDDIFLFEKFQKVYPNQVNYLKSTSAIVMTHPVKTWKELIHQRMRWAAKSSSYNLWFGKFVGLIVLLTNLSLIISLFMMFAFRENSAYFLLSTLLKIGMDSILIHQTSLFYRGKNKKIKGYAFGSILYPFFSVYIILKVLTSKYNWKGRSFKK
jgi:cellulose synthase/poly-beta-1,6-N-acetylglucosamine synthase-like glycosyltransferase